MIIKEAITEKQSVVFYLDNSPDCSGLEQIDVSAYQKCIVICDEYLKKIWWPILRKKLEKRINISHVEYLSASESSKNLESYVKLVDILAKFQCSRDDLIIAVGGGTILDVAAFLASTYMRGIPLLMLPTTLIGQADASTAGKTCLNAGYSKNLLGTLYLPAYVYNNAAILNTNSSYDLRQGFSEIFKYALLGSHKLLNLLKEYNRTPDNNKLIEIIKETIKVRMMIRKKDPLASNFGHTFGHAFEKYSNFAVGHGDAIAVGIAMALELSVIKKIISEKLKKEIFGLMRELKLNNKVEKGIDPKKLTEIMLKDKKSSNTAIRLVLIEDIARPFETSGSPFYSVNPTYMQNFLSEILHNEIYFQKNHWDELRNEI